MAAESHSVWRGLVTDVRADGPDTHVELVVAPPVRLVAELSLEALRALDLRPGMAATALVASTSIIVQH
jgi:molybdopterin-binding protein